MPPRLRLTTDTHLSVENRLDVPRMFRPLEVPDDITSSLLARAVEHVVRVVATRPIAFTPVVGVVDNLGENESDERDQEGDTTGDDLEEECSFLSGGLGRL